MCYSSSQMKLNNMESCNTNHDVSHTINDDLLIN